MKKIILDIFKYSGISFFLTFLILVVLIVPNGVNSFLNGTSFQLPLNLLTISGIANGSENSLEIHFTQSLFWQILLLFTCLTFVILGVVYAKKNKKALYLVISLAAICTLLLGSIQLSRIQQEPLKTATIQDIDSIINGKKSSIVYVGRDNCPDCILYKPKLISYLEKENLEINYLNTTGNKKEVDDFRRYYNRLWIGYTRLDRKNKVCTIIKNTLEENTCLNVKEEPIPQNLSNKWWTCTTLENHVQRSFETMN